MRNQLLAAAALSVAFLAFDASAKVRNPRGAVSGLEPDKIEKLLREHGADVGFSVERRALSNGRPYLRLSMGPARVIASPENCSGAGRDIEDCRALKVMALYADSASSAAAIRFNQNNLNARAYHNGGSAVLDRVVTGPNGVTRANVVDAVDAVFAAMPVYETLIQRARRFSDSEKRTSMVAPEQPSADVDDDALASIDDGGVGPMTDAARLEAFVEADANPPVAP